MAGFKTPVKLPANAGAKLKRAYVACKAGGYRLGEVFEPFAAQARSEGWPYVELPTGHDCQVEAVDDCVSFLLGLA